MGLGEVTGRLRPGLTADLVVIDRDLFAVDVHEIHATRVLRTYAGSRLVYQVAAPDGGTSEGTATS